MVLHLSPLLRRPPLQVSRFLRNAQIDTLDRGYSKPPGRASARGVVPNGGPRGVPPRELDGLDDFEDDLSDIEDELEGGGASEEVSIDVADEARLHLDSLWRKNQDASKLMVGAYEGGEVQPVRTYTCEHRYL